LGGRMFPDCLAGLRRIMCQTYQKTELFKLIFISIAIFLIQYFLSFCVKMFFI
jgi:hypothetical protein